MPEVSQCLWRLAHRIPHGCRAYAEPLGQTQKRLPIRTCIRSYRSQLAFLKKSHVIVQRRNVGQPDTCHGKGSAPIEGLQSGRHQFTSRGEQDRPIERLRRYILCVTDGVSA
jgi:hypothetical protein